MSEESNNPLRRRKYEEPPVIEAIARLSWGTPLEWGIVGPGAMYEKLKGEYPAQPEVRSLVQAQLANEGGGGSGTLAPALQMRTGPGQLVFANGDHSRLLIVAQEQISVHGLPPYEGWESLELRLERAVQSVCGALGVDPTFSGTGVRYINRIRIPSEEVEFDRWLTFGFNVPDAFPKQAIGFLDRIELAYPDGVTRLNFTWATARTDESLDGFILDLDLVATPERGLSWDEALHSLRDLKLKEGEAFESLLQPAMREVFREVS